MNRSLRTRTCVLALLSVLLSAHSTLAQLSPTRDQSADADLQSWIDDESDDVVDTPAKAAAPGSSYRVFTHWAYEGENYTVINDQLVNGRPDAAVMAVQHFKPYPESPEVLNNHNIGVAYRQDVGRWVIFNQDLTPMAFDTYFMVRTGSATLHRATPSNIANGKTIVDDPRGNGNPAAKLQITSVLGPNGNPSVYVDHPVGVAYNGSKWTIVHLDGSPVQNDECYFVLFEGSFSHTTSQANVQDHATVIDDQRTNGKLNVTIVVTRSASAGNPTASDSPLGVYYDGSKWAIFNEDLSPMPAGVSFNVMVVAPLERNSIVLKGTKLLVHAFNAQAGTVVIINGVDQPTRSRPRSSESAYLKVRHATSVVTPGVPFTFQLRNPDGQLSYAESFTL